MCISAIETALDQHATYPTLEPTYNPTLLARAPALSADIAYLLDVPESSWKSHPIHKDLVTPSLPPALQTYITRLQTLAASPDPSPLLAHSYVRYLGDLSGGQSIRRIISKAYGLEEEGQEGKELGVSFYVFKELRGSKEASIYEGQHGTKIKKSLFHGNRCLFSRSDPYFAKKVGIVIKPLFGNCTTHRLFVFRVSLIL